MTSPKVRHLLILSDIHVGGSTAIWPKDYVTQHGHKLHLNPLQIWLEQCWDHGLKWVDQQLKGKPFILGLNGDLIDGIHHRSTEIMTPVLSDQIGACIHLLKPLAKKADKIYATIGTESHTGNAEAHIADALKAVKANSYNTSFNSVTLEINKVRTELMHHISGASRPWSEASAHSSHLNLRRAECSRLGKDAPHVIVRGHIHRFGTFSDGHGLTVVTPSWQGLTRYAWKVVPGAECVVGFVLIDYTDPQDGIVPHVKHSLYHPSPDPRYVH